MRAIYILSVILFLGLSTSSFATITPWSRIELIQHSKLIFTGKVTAKNMHLNDKGNLIVTDYTFQIDDILKGSSPSSITLTFAGGTLNGETHELSDIPTFDVDLQNRVLVMVEQSNYPLFSPISGTYQGKFIESIDPAYQYKIVRGEKGQLIKNKDHRAPSFDDFVIEIKQDIELAKTTPVPSKSLLAASLPYLIPTTPQKTYDASQNSSTDVLGRIVSPLGEETKNTQLIDSTLRFELNNGTDELYNRPSDNNSRWTYSHRAKNVPVVFEPLPAGGSISYTDQAQMAYWNKYANIFQVYTNPNGSWAWQNNVFEIAGFVDNSTMIAQFGQGWNGNTLAICWRRWDGTDFTIEADICINNSYSWTTNNFASYFDPNLYSINRTFTHEIGHSWGLSHQFNFQSVMNYSPNKYRAYNCIFMDDAEGIRSAFPSQTQNLTDIHVKSFYNNGYQNYDDASLSHSSISAGSSFSVSNFMIENVGTTTKTPIIDWYLVPTFGSLSNSIYLHSTTHSSLNKAQYSITSRTIVVPSSVSTGTYYLAAVANISGDGVSQNNACWFESPLYVTGSSTVYAPIANFSANITNVTAGQQVYFTDLSSNVPTSWSWIFYGGHITNSSLKNPVITYNNPGFYTVSLTATNSAGSHSITRTNYITVSPNAVHDFEFIDGIDIFPNPIVTQTVFVDIEANQSDELNISLVNTLGQEIKSGITRTIQKGSNRLNFNIGNVATGNYYLLIRSLQEKKTSMKKIEVVR